MNSPDLNNRGAMHLRLLLPTEVLVNESVTKIIAEAENGAFCLLPRHVDFVAALVPGILAFNTRGNEERFVGIDEGVLVKRGSEVFVSTLNAVEAENLEDLQAMIEKQFLELDEHERMARTALARLEAGTLRGFRELQERTHG